MAVEQTLRAIRRTPGAVAARHYARPVHVNASEIDVTSPRRPRRTTATETAADDVTDGVGCGSVIHRGRTVVRLHTNKNNNKRSEKPVENQTVPAVTVANTEPSERCTTGSALQSEEGLAKKGTIKRHTSAGVKVPVNDDRRPSVTDEILREQEALFDTMIMEEMEGQQTRVRRKSYPVEIGGGGGDGGGKQPHRTRETRKKSLAAAMVYGEHADKPAKHKTAGTNWKLNYDVIIEESGIEPVSFTFKLNNTTKKESDSRSSDNGKLDANHNVVIRNTHDNDNERDKKNNSIKKHAKTVINKNQSNNDNSEGGAVGVPQKKTKIVKKKIIVKKKVVKKKKKEEEEEKEEVAENQQDKQGLQKKKTPSPPKKGSSSNAVATPAVITPFVRASFGKTFISPSQVSSTKSKFEKPKPKIKLETPPPPAPPPAPITPPVADGGSSSDEDESSDEDDSSSSSSSTSLCSGTSGSTFYDSDDYGDKRVACSNSSFDSGLPSSPVPAPDPIGRNTTTLTPHNIIILHNIIYYHYYHYYHYYYYYYYYYHYIPSTQCCKGQFK